MVSITFRYLYLKNTLEVVIINPWLQLVVIFYMVAKSLEKYLPCFHVSRVYFLALLHQIFILEVFIIKKNAKDITNFLNFKKFFATNIGDHLVALFFATDTSEMHLGRFKIATDNVGRKGHTFQPGY